MTMTTSESTLLTSISTAILDISNKLSYLKEGQDAIRVRLVTNDDNGKCLNGRDVSQNNHSMSPEAIIARSVTAAANVEADEGPKEKLAKIRNQDIIDLVIDPENVLDKEQRASRLRAIGKIANDAIIDHALRCEGDDYSFKATWVKTASSERNKTITSFEKMVYKQVGVCLEKCESHWAATHILSQKWDNRHSYQERLERLKANKNVNK